MLSDGSLSAAADLRTTLQDGTWDLTDTLGMTGDDLDALERARDALRFLTLLQISALALALAGLATLWFTGPAPRPAG